MLRPLNDGDAGDGSLHVKVIVDRIITAVMEQRLPPGTKLNEAALCEAFGVGRMRVRQSLLLLANQDIVVLQQNRGAFVASPSQQDARDVFEARRVIEPDVVRLAVERATPKDLGGLTEIIQAEADARRKRNRRDAIRLSGAFHVHLAASTGNDILARMTKALVTRTSLIIGLFGAAGTSHCPEDEHGEILAAIKQQDAETAVRLICAHLRHIEAGLDLTAGANGPIDIQGILSD